MSAKGRLGARACDVVLALSVACTALWATGCGSGDPFSYKKVTGSVSYEDGSPIPSESIIVTFSPQVEAIDEQTHPRSGMAYVKADGTFDVVTSYQYGDGIVRGEHKVLVAIRGGPTGASDTQPLIPSEYGRLATTPLVVHTDDAPFEIKIRKPGN